MSSLFSVISICLILGSLVYFWQRARLHGTDWSVIIFSYIFFPVAVIGGLYWGVKDFYYYLKSK